MTAAEAAEHCVKPPARRTPLARPQFSRLARPRPAATIAWQGHDMRYAQRARRTALPPQRSYGAWPNASPVHSRPDRHLVGQAVQASRAAACISREPASGWASTGRSPDGGVRRLSWSGRHQPGCLPRFWHLLRQGRRPPHVRSSTKLGPEQLERRPQQPRPPFWPAWRHAPRACAPAVLDCAHSCRGVCPELLPLASGAIAGLCGLVASLLSLGGHVGPNRRDAGANLLAALLASLGRRGRQLANLVLQSFDALVQRRRLASVH